MTGEVEGRSRVASCQRATSTSRVGYVNIGKEGGDKVGQQERS